MSARYKTMCFLIFSAALWSGCIGDPGGIVYLGGADVEEGDGSEVERDVVEPDEDPNVDSDERYEGLSDREYFYHNMVDVYCEASWECFDSSSHLRSGRRTPTRFSSVEECKEVGRERVELFDFDDLTVSIAEGRVELDRRRGAECREQLKETLCHGNLAHGYPVACVEMLGGQVEEDGRCVHDLDCHEGFWCDGEAVESACYGLCKEQLTDCGCEEEERCSVSGECIPQDPECRTNRDCEGQKVCAEGQCEDRFSYKSAGDQCDDHARMGCLPNLTCRADLGAGDLFVRCRRLRKRDEICVKSSDCIVGYYCATRVEGLVEMSRCQPLLRSGEACNYDGECETNDCDGECRPRGFCEVE